MAELLRAAREASRRGVPLARVDEEIRKRTGGEFTDVRSLATAARDSGVSLEQLGGPAPEPSASPSSEPDASTGEKIGGALRLASQGATFGFSDELTGILAGTGAALVPGGEGFGEARRRVTGETREKLAQSRRDLGLLGTAAEVGGAVAVPVGAAGRFVTRGASAASRIGRGALAGGVEGGLYGAGTAEGSLRQRAGAAVVPGILGAATGAAIPAAVDAARVTGRAAGKAGRRLKKKATAVGNLDEVEELERTIGPRLGSEMREEAGILGKPSKVREEVAQARRGIYGELDEIEAIENVPLRKALQGEDVAPFVPDDVAAGKRPPSFVEAQGALRQVRKAKGSALRSGDAASVKSLSEAERELGSRLSDAVEGFDEANAAYAQHMRRARALEEGSRVASKSADEVAEAFGRLDSDAERQAFRESLGHWFLKRLEDNTALPTTLKKIQNAPETRSKLRILFDDSDAFEAFVDAARVAEETRESAKAGRIVERELLRQLGRVLPWIGGAGVGAGGAAVLLD